MIRRRMIALSLVLALAPAVAAHEAFAQSAGAKAAVDAAKASGAVGEQGDGYLGFVSGGGGALGAAVAQINAGRARAYADIAGKSGVSPAAAGEATAQQLFTRLPAGAYYRPLGGEWTRK